MENTRKDNEEALTDDEGEIDATPGTIEPPTRKKRDAVAQEFLKQTGGDSSDSSGIYDDEEVNNH